MSASRQVLELGAFGRVPVDTLFQLHIETNTGDVLSIYQTRCQASIGGWVYEAAACLAKYLESHHFHQVYCRHGGGENVGGRQQPMSGKYVVELGAGTGVVGIMAAYLGASVVSTDLDSLIPLIAYNINQNSNMLNAGSIIAKPLCWGSEPDSDLLQPDFVVMANCIYYEPSLEPLLKTVLALTSGGQNETVVLACYEERTKEISQLVSRWHSLLSQYFVIHDVERSVLDANYMKDYVRIVIIVRRNRDLDTKL